MTREEAKRYYQDLAQKAGLTVEEQASVLQALDNEKVAKVVLDAFVPRPQYSSDLDARQKERDAAIAEAQTIRDWHVKEGKPAFEQNKAGIETLKTYIDRYGPLDEGEKKEAVKVSGLTMDQVEKMVTNKLREQGQLYVNLTKDAVRLSQDYFQRFKEPLDVDALEKIALDKQLPLSVAYKELIAPKVDAAKEVQHKAELKAAREEGARDALSRRNLPTDTGPREPHPIFDQKKVDEKVDSDKLSREAFMDGWNNAAQAVTEQNK